MSEQEAYQQAMREAADAAWERDWLRAIEAYQHALEIAPNDPQALAGLALSLMEAGRYDQALIAYERVSKLVPNDPLPHEKIAQIYELVDRPREAAAAYLRAAELHARRNPQRAIPYWEMAVYLNPDLLQAHLRLATLYEKEEATRERAVYNWLAIARLFQAHGQNSRADQVLQHALELDPINPTIRSAVEDFKRGLPIPPVPAPAYEEPPALKREDEEEEGEEYEVVEEEAAHPPAEEAARHAMATLADLVWSGEVPQEALTTLVQAIDAQQIGEIEEALDLYNQVRESGLDHPALLFNLGLLYRQAGQVEKAVEALQQVMEQEEYAIAAHLELGQAYHAQSDGDKAAHHLIEALRLADERLNTQTDQQGYERLIERLKEQTDEQVGELCQALIFYLNDPNWRTKLQNTLTGYAMRGKTAYVRDLVDLIIEGGRPEVAEIMQRIDQYLARGMPRMAMEEAHYAIQKAPDYLPAHRRVADLLVREGRTEEAAYKLNLVANTYLIRGNEEKAADLYAEVIDLWPADITPRRRVIEMLKKQGRVAEALNHYAKMADVYYTMLADPNRAIEVYREGLAYATQSKADPALTIPLLKGLADIESQRLNYRRALNYYRQVLEITPDDEQVALAVIQIGFQVGESREAIAALDTYLRQCAASGREDRMVAVLEEQVKQHPNVIPLRQRLAEVYRRKNRIAEAVEQMDAIGELQLEQGRTREAIQTIRRIIEMNPPNVEGYRTLLSQLETSNL